MNDALALAPQFGLPGLMETLKGVAEQFAFLRDPPKRAVRQLSRSSEDAIRGACDVLDRIILGALEKRTAKEFDEYRRTMLAQYFRAHGVVAEFARLSIPDDVRRDLISQSFVHVEEQIKAHASSLGPVERDQAIFTLWTFKKIAALANRLEVAIPDEHEQVDRQLSMQFSASITWARFHLDCLMTSFRTHKQIYPDVRELVIEGLRAAVNAYAYIKKAADLRSDVLRLPMSRAAWDAEDQELLDASMKDLEREPIP